MQSPQIVPLSQNRLLERLAPHFQPVPLLFRDILLARIFGPIEPAGWIVKGLAHATRAGREPYALGWASCPGFAHQYNPVRANPPFDAA